MNISLPANLIFSLQALADVSNLNIIPKSTVDWFVRTITGIENDSSSSEKSSTDGDETQPKNKNKGLMGNVGYLLIIFLGAGIALVFIFLLAYYAKKYEK